MYGHVVVLARNLSKVKLMCAGSQNGTAGLRKNAEFAIIQISEKVKKLKKSKKQKNDFFKKMTF